jgi:hypothetical protein
MPIETAQGSMGVHVILEIDPRGIDKTAWKAAYRETLALLKRWPSPLLGFGCRIIKGVRVPMYLRSIAVEEDLAEASWRVVGDRDSMQTAERASLYCDLAHYTDENLAHYTDERLGSASSDIVLLAARRGAKDTKVL